MNNQNPHNEITLARTLTGFDATMLGVGAMIGAGVFVLTGIATGEAGPAAIIVFALNGIVTLFTAFTYAELASSIPEAGGGYAFVKRAFPGVTGFTSGWMLWFAYTVACSLYAVGFGSFFIELLESYFPGMYHIFIGLVGRGGAVSIITFAIAAFFITLNVVGADVTGKAENVITVAKIIVLGFFIFFGLVAIYRTPALVETNCRPTGRGFRRCDGEDVDCVGLDRRGNRGGRRCDDGGLPGGRRACGEPRRTACGESVVIG